MPISKRRQSELDSTPDGQVLCGDCLKILPTLPDCSFDSVVTDPPYGLEFMGKGWDREVPGPEYWRAVYRVLKPARYILVMGGTRTYHRLTCAIEDAGFEIRDCLMWLYGSGFPKSKGCLKPAYEPIILACRPGLNTLPLQIDNCRTEINGTRLSSTGGMGRKASPIFGEFERQEVKPIITNQGRYPANVCHDGSDEVLEAFAAFGERPGNGNRRLDVRDGGTVNVYDGFKCGRSDAGMGRDDTGTAARFFYCAKASTSERDSFNNHPTVKPIALMKWLVRLITPPGGKVLDPFAGSGSTLIAAVQEGMSCVGIELDPTNYDIARIRLKKRS